MVTFDGQVVGGRGHLAGDGVVRLAHVRPRVFVNGLLDGVRGRLDVGQRSVELPGEVGGRDGGGRACERHAVVELDGTFAGHHRLLRTVWR